MYASDKPGTGAPGVRGKFGRSAVGKASGVRAARTPGDDGKRRAGLSGRLVRGRRWLGSRMGVHRKAWIFFYALFTFGFCVGGYLFQHQAFTPESAPGQVYVLAFEQNPRAVVRLDVTVFPNDPSADQVTATVVRGKPGRWVLVVDCANTPDTDVFQGNATLTTLAPSLAENEHAVKAWSLSPRTGTFTTSLGCFQPRPSGVYTIDNVTLPALGTDGAITQTPDGVPQLYMDGGTLAQVFPGEQCPAGTGSAGGVNFAEPSQSLGATGTAPETPQPSETETPTPQPSGTATVTPEPSGTTATPQPSGTGGTSGPTPGVVPAQPSATPVAPGCLLSAIWPQDAFTHYTMPTVLETQESVQQVNFGAYVFESDYPTATYPRTGGSINWDAGGELAPSLHVSDPASDRVVNVDTFYSGILFGLAGATGLAAIDQIERWIEDHGPAEAPAGAPAGGGPAGLAAPAADPAQPARRRPPRASGNARAAASERRRARVLRQIKRWQDRSPRR